MKKNILKMITYFIAVCMVFTLNACKDDGENGEASLVNILTEGNPPIAEAGADQSVSSGDTITLNGSASSDSDGTIVRYVWTIPGIGTREGIEVTETLPIGTPSGTYTVSLTVTDNDGNTDNDTLSINVNVVPTSNIAPVANNVSQAFGNCLTTPIDITLNGTDVDGDALVYSIVSSASSGTVTISGNIATYTNTTFCSIVGTDLQLLEDTFTYKVNDGTVDSASATVTLDFSGAAT
jgi:chitinase